MTDRLPLSAWVREGLRAGVFLRPRTGDAQPLPWQVLVLFVAATVLELALGYFEVPGDVLFDARGFLVPWWNLGALLLVAWWLLPRGGVPAWFALWTVALVPANCVSQLLSIGQAQDWLPVAIDTGAIAWTIYALLWLWVIGVAVRLASAFGVSPGRNAAMVLSLAVLFGIGAWQFPDRAWVADTSELAEDTNRDLQLTQETFETQQTLLRQALANLKPQRPGVVDVYGVVFSPYADEDVFLRDSTLAAKVIEERFDAAGRLVHLANHPATADSLAWATPANLERTIEAVAGRMDRENDVLFVYLTSHGASDFRLEASNPPLSVDTVSPGELRQALDNAGVRNRVIVISACYSGGWLGPIADDHTLVMTAADATHTSFGCGAGSELTFFGRALFDEQLRRTHSLEQAFAAAVPVIKRREEEAGKADGFSNPQILVGDKIRPVLRQLEARLDAK
jgi:hypothetical protein